MKNTKNRRTTTVHAELSLDQEQETLQYLQDIGRSSNLPYYEIEMFTKVIETHHETIYPNHNPPLHSHTFFELMHINNTCGIEHLIGTRRYQLQKGDIICAPPGLIHRTVISSKMTEPCSRDILWISAEWIASKGQWFPDKQLKNMEHPYFLRTAGTKWDFLSNLFHSGVRESEDKAFRWEDAVLGNTILLLTHIGRAFMDQGMVPIKAEQSALLDSIVDYVKGNLANKITLPDTAKRFFVSESTVNRLFQKEMGVSFYRYVTQYRLVEAQSLILKDVPIESIGAKVGFSDYPTFYRAFKNEYGMSPRQYKKLDTLKKDFR